MGFEICPTMELNLPPPTFKRVSSSMLGSAFNPFEVSHMGT